MAQPLKLLLVEDNPADAELVLRELRRAGFEPDWQRVDTEPAFLERLHDGLDIVISDFDMPQFNGLRALELLKQGGWDIPFILVSGTIGEETAVISIKKGATDYLLKDRLARLGPVVLHALAEAALRRERRQADDALRVAHAQLAQLLAYSPAVLYGLKLEGDKIVPYLVSENVVRLLGFTVAEALSYEWWLGQLHPDDRARALHSVSETLKTGAGRAEYRMRHKEGHYCWIDDARRVVHDSAGQPADLIGVWSDITERKQAEAALQREQALFSSLIATIPDHIYFKDRQCRFVRINASMARRVGLLDGADAIGKTDLDFFLGEHARLAHRDDQQVLATGVPVLNLEEKETWADGRVTWASTTKVALRNPEGVITGLVGISRDITEAKKLEEQFLHAQRMEAIGMLASGVAHDLNNILAPMLMGAALLKMRSTVTAKDAEILSMIENSGQRGAAIIRQLLSFSRIDSGERIVVQPKHLLRDMLQIMRETFPRNITIVEEVAPDLWTVKADPTQLHQVIMNLCVNARDAMPAGGTLTLEARNQVVTGDAPVDPALQPGAYLLITVRDTGHGIPPEVMRRIFEPFFTTKEVGKGTGLGLSTLFSIVKSHAGVVRVESEPGRGAIFRVYLPALGEKEGVVASASPVPRGREELILVVDDEAPIREATRSFLERYGYRVVLADSGEAAIMVVIQHQGGLGLVLTDMMMPGMSGLAFIRALRILEPGLRVIATSGMVHEHSRDELAALGVTSMLAKPFTPETLLKAVSAALAK